MKRDVIFGNLGVASFELNLIFLKNTFCHHRSPFTEYKSIILYWGSSVKLKRQVSSPVSTIYNRNRKGKLQNTVLCHKKLIFFHEIFH